MISNKIRENRRGRAPPKMSKNIERLYKEGKCSDCSVVVTRMDFAKILGKFTKVKIQYESGSPRTRKGTQQNTSPSNTRLKSNENGMVLIHRNAYNQHPADLLKPTKANQNQTPRPNNNVKDKKVTQVNNILKENNRLNKKTPVIKKSVTFSKSEPKPVIKRYGIIFKYPEKIDTDINDGNLTLKNILPFIDKDILPSDDWSIDYLPKYGEPKEDKVYDRIAAELEDLMNNEKSADKISENNKELSENKDDFPSIMDILNDNTPVSNQANNQSNASVVQPNLESSDVEAMLLGKTNDTSKEESTPMEVDNSDMSNLMDEMVTVQENVDQQHTSDVLENPNSPSILDETLKTGVEEHLPKEPLPESEPLQPVNKNPSSNITPTDLQKPNMIEDKNHPITHIVFKKHVNGVNSKSVTCPNNLKYTVELDGRSVTFLGAPKVISCQEDLQVLLQIVNETELNNFYVFRMR